MTKAHQKVSFDDYIDNQGLSAYLNYLWDNDINIYVQTTLRYAFANQFLSPIIDGAPTFYRFYITGYCSRTRSPELVELSFKYHATLAHFLFQGRQCVTLDGNGAVQRVNMTVNKHINLNWVRELQHRPGLREDAKTVCGIMVKRAVCMPTLVFQKVACGMYGERVKSYRNVVR